LPSIGTRALSYAFPFRRSRRFRCAHPSASGKVFDIDLKTSKVIATVDVPPSSGALYIPTDTSDHRAFLSCPQAGNIQILIIARSTVQGVIPLTKGVDGLAWVDRL